MVGKIHWPGKEGSGPPPDKPLCGFNNELCEKGKTHIIIIGLHIIDTHISLDIYTLFNCAVILSSF